VSRAAACADLYEEEGEFDGAASDGGSEGTDSASVALETISVEGDLLDIGEEIDANGGFMGPHHDPFDPNAWAAEDPGQLEALGDSDSAAFAASSRLSSRLSSRVSGRLPPPGEVSGMIDAMSSRLSSVTPHHRRRSSADPVAEPASAQPHAAASGDADSDSDELVTEEEARAAVTEMDSRQHAGDTPIKASLSAMAGLTPRTTSGTSALLDAMSLPLAGAPSGAMDAVLGMVVYGFGAEEEGELTVREGDEVYVLAHLEGGWTHVQLVASGEDGNVPAWAVEETPVTAGASGVVPAVAGGTPEPLDAPMEAGLVAKPPPQVAQVFVTGDVPTTGVSQAPHVLASVPEDNPFGLEGLEVAGVAAAPVATAAAAIGASATEDNPFGLIDISSPTGDDNDSGGCEARSPLFARDDPLGGLGDLNTFCTPPPEASAAVDVDAAPAPMSAAPAPMSAAPARLISTPSSVDGPAAFKSQPITAAPIGWTGSTTAAGLRPAAQSGLPAVDNPFGAAALLATGAGPATDSASAGAPVPVGVNPFDATGGLARAAVDAEEEASDATAARQFQGAADNPFGGL
jgi:hypothetical protein